MVNKSCRCFLAKLLYCVLHLRLAQDRHGAPEETWLRYRLKRWTGEGGDNCPPPYSGIRAPAEGG